MDALWGILEGVPSVEKELPSTVKSDEELEKYTVVCVCVCACLFVQAHTCADTRMHTHTPRMST